DPAIGGRDHFHARGALRTAWSGEHADQDQSQPDARRAISHHPNPPIRLGVCYDPGRVPARDCTRGTLHLKRGRIMLDAWRALALAILLTLGLATSPTLAQWGYGAGFRGYVGPNLYEPGFYTAYGYAPPVYSLYPAPRFYLGSPSGNPGYYSGSP